MYFTFNFSYYTTFTRILSNYTFDFVLIGYNFVQKIQHIIEEGKYFVTIPLE